MPRAPLPHRLRRALLGVAVALGALTLTGALLWSQAPKWGIPYARYTNDAGSPCRTTWTGYVCSPMTVADLTERTGLVLPEGTVVERAEYVSTHDFALTARLLLPEPERRPDVGEQLEELYGPCQRDQPNPLPSDWSGRCVRTSDGKRVEGQPPPTTWRVATGTPPGTEQLALDLDISSR
ncbi:hypothetical protein GC722_06265 [Auraticoccus sp. F435]|uniref:Uncharacterized protein n=1 Tax=Auraticoccus cholistanensis TaxID=2656650 RepID=A0A6A9USF9_9ACTN|nr:hypothetical protein [Auraticoccus cholistanensis]MVA75631.1 hypothetical protein [Auraticoccus cholistanensis]